MIFSTTLGGGWPDLIGNPTYENTCTIRLSITLNRPTERIKTLIRKGLIAKSDPQILFAYWIELIGEF